MKKKFVPLMLVLAALSAVPATALARCWEGVFCESGGETCIPIIICCSTDGTRCRVFWQMM